MGFCDGLRAEAGQRGTTKDLAKRGGIPSETFKMGAPEAAVISGSQVGGGDLTKAPSKPVSVQPGGQRDVSQSSVEKQCKRLLRGRR